MKRDLISGFALGLLVGLLIGLSIAQVTGIILGALTSLLAAFFGLRPDKEGETGNKVVIGAFSFSCFCALFLGIYMRTHDVLAPSLEKEIATYKAANFSEDEIKELIYFKKFGLVANQKHSFSKEAASANAVKSTLLMAEDVDLPICDVALNELSIQEIEEAFTSSGGAYQRLFQSLSKNSIDDAQLRVILMQIQKLLCE